MERNGHTGLTFGFVSLLSAIRVRDNLSPRLDYLTEAPEDEIPPVEERWARRAPLVIAPAIVTGSAVLTSANLDRVERQLFGAAGHRREGHSIIYSTGGREAVDKGSTALRQQVETVCETLGIDDGDYVQLTARATEDITTYIATGAYAGQLTHVIGDLPTLGNHGVSALQALMPLSDKGINFGLIASDSSLLNDLFWKVGMAVGLGSWMAIGVYATTPRWPSAILADTIETVRTSPPKDTFDSAISRLIEFPSRVAAATEGFDPSALQNTEPGILPDPQVHDEGKY